MYIVYIVYRGEIFELFSVHGAEELSRLNSSPARAAGQVVGKTYFDSTLQNSRISPQYMKVEVTCVCAYQEKPFISILEIKIRPNFSWNFFCLNKCSYCNILLAK